MHENAASSSNCMRWARRQSCAEAIIDARELETSGRFEHYQHEALSWEKTTFFEKEEEIRLRYGSMLFSHAKLQAESEDRMLHVLSAGFVCRNMLRIDSGGR